MKQVALNKIKTNPFAYTIWLVLSCAVHIVLFGPRVRNDYQVLERVMILILAVCTTLPIHELLHFVFMKTFCKGSVKIRFMKSPLGLPTLGTVAQAQFQKWQHIVIYLAPFVLLTLLIDVFIAFSNEVELIFFIVSICNCSGCFYDIIDAFSAANGKR